MRKPWDFSSLSFRVFFFVNHANRGGQIRAGEVIMSLPKSVGIGPDGIGVGWDVGVAGSEVE